MPPGAVDREFVYIVLLVLLFFFFFSFVFFFFRFLFPLKKENEPAEARPGDGDAFHLRQNGFILVGEADWLDPTRPMRKRCNDKVKGKVKKQTAPQAPPPEPWFFSSLNDMSIGDTNEAFDALTYFEEQLLSPIQPVVRSFTLYSTGLIDSN